MASAGQASAGIPVIDVANLAQGIQQVVAWGEQYAQMVQQIQSLQQQYQQAQQTYSSISGIRGMASLVNNPALRTYLPSSWTQSLTLMTSPGSYTTLAGSAAAIRDASKIVDVTATALPPTSLLGQAYTGAQDQAAINRAMSEAAYNAASDRTTAIQTLLDKINDAPDEKDVLDLQARIQAEQVMVANENAKLLALSQLQQAQRDIQAQRAREISIASGKRRARARLVGPPPCAPIQLFCCLQRSLQSSSLDARRTTFLPWQIPTPSSSTAER